MPNVRCDGQRIVAIGDIDLARLNIGLAADRGVLIDGNATAKDVNRICRNVAGDRRADRVVDVEAGIKVARSVDL